jgi:hypothetical protein
MRRVSESTALETRSIRQPERAAPRFTERDQHVIVAALAGLFDEATRPGAIKVLRAALTTPRTALRALELTARLNGELDSRSRH